MGDGRFYCGPTVVASITGVPVEKVTKWMLNRDRRDHAQWVKSRFGRVDSFQRKRMRRMKITSTTFSTLKASILHYMKYRKVTFDHFDFSLLFKQDKKRFTVEDWLSTPSTIGGPVKKKVYIVHCPGHWMVCYDGMLNDTHVKGKPVKYHLHPLRNRTIKGAYVVNIEAKTCS